MARHVLTLSKANRGKAMLGIERAPDGWILELRAPKRSGEQNALLHAALSDVARQVEWAGAKRDIEAWKDIFTAALRSSKHSLDVVPGINGGFVLLGMHTSGMSKAEFSELLELVFAFGAEHGVTFHDSQGAGGANNPARVAA